jgi:predicted signal transduction protein with EAL and GGDEF domain
MVRSMIDLAHGLGMHVVAEGVEDADTLRDLATLDCDLAQGYHISHPLDRDAFLAFAGTGVHDSSRAPAEHTAAAQVESGEHDPRPPRPLSSISGAAE